MLKDNSKKFFLITVVVFLLLLQCFFVHNLKAQSIDFDNYTPISSSGEIPLFFKTSTEKYKELISNKLLKNESKKARKAKQEFYLKSTFAIDDILKSGEVLFNDPVGNYVNKILNEIKEKAELKNIKATVYLLKSNFSNAFATDEGHIFITTGLISRLENEAQLAFVLCHELVHFEKKHSIDIFVASQDFDKKDLKETGGLETEKRLLSHTAYSREKETEADIRGLSIYLKTNYDPKEAVKMFDNLATEKIPCDDFIFTPSFFEGKNTKWPDSIYSPILVTQLQLDQKSNDTFSTHPNIFNRKTYLSKDIYIADTVPNKLKFCVSEDEFNVSKTVCLFEYCRQALLEKDFFNSIFISLALLEKHPKSNYLKKTVAKALYYISKYKTYNLKFNTAQGFKTLYGNPSKVSYFFDRVSAKEASNIALRAWVLLKGNSTIDSVEIEVFTKDIVSFTLPKHYPQVTINNVFVDSLEESRLFRTDYEEILNNRAFTNTLSKFFNNQKDNEKKPTINSDKINYFGKFNSKLKKARGKGVIILSPFTYSVDIRKEIPIRYEATEKKSIDFISHIKRAADAANLPVEILSGANMAENTSVTLNRYSILNDWLRQTMNTEETNFLPADYGIIDSISKTLDATHVCLLGNIFITKKKEELKKYIAFSILIPFYSWPFTIPYIFQRQIETYYFMTTIEINTRKIVVYDLRKIKSENKGDITTATIYDFMLKIKQQQFESNDF
ncbi:MAG: M48 family metallopeptidase [Bacteroidota bacterium]